MDRVRIEGTKDKVAGKMKAANAQLPAGADGITKLKEALLGIRLALAATNEATKAATELLDYAESCTSIDENRRHARAVLGKLFSASAHQLNARNLVANALSEAERTATSTHGCYARQGRR